MSRADRWFRRRNGGCEYSKRSVSGSLFLRVDAVALGKLRRGEAAHKGSKIGRAMRRILYNLRQRQAKAA